MERQDDTLSLEAKNVCFSYQQGSPILDSLNVTIPKGKITALIGRNGCGKSTLLRLFNRLIEADSGQFLLEKKSLESYSAKALAQKMAHLTQSPQAPEGLTVLELVKFGRHPYQGFLGRSSKEDKDIVALALEQTALTELSHRGLHELSGGQRQRAWIAMALAQNTEYLLLDEPTTYLDISHQLEVLELLAALNEEQNKTIVMVVHEPNHASQYANHVVCLAGGKVLTTGSPKEIFTEQTMIELYGVRPLIFEGDEASKPWCVPHSPVQNGKEHD